MRENWRKRSQTAQGMVEFALILPVLLLLILGIFAFGHFFYVYAATVSASREAARYGAAVGPSELGIPRYKDCKSIRAAARRVASIAGTAEINISYDTGPGNPYFATCDEDDNLDPENADVDLGDRITVEVITKYEPIVPLVNIPPFDITSHSSRTILRSVPIGKAIIAVPPPDPTKNDTNLLITSDNPDFSYVNGPVVVTFSLTYTDGPGPTGDVTIVGSDSYTSDGNNDITCTVPITDGSCTLTPDTPGVWEFSAAYQPASDSDYNGSRDTEEHQVYYKTTLAILEPLVDGESVAGTPLSVKVRLSTDPADTGGYRPTGNITISDGMGNECEIEGPFTLPYEGSCPLTFNTTEDRMLTAEYITDGKFETAKAEVWHVVKAAHDSQIVIDSRDPNSSTVGQEVTVAYTVYSLSGDSNIHPTGSVTVTDGLRTCSGGIDASGKGSCKIELTLAGTRGLRATYSGDVLHNDSTYGPVDHVVIPADVNLTASQNPEPSGSGQKVTFTFIVKPTIGKSAIPTGTVQVRENGIMLCEASVDALGSGSCVVEFTISGITAETKTIEVAYLGDGNFNPKSVTLTHTVDPCPVLRSIRFLDNTDNERRGKNQFVIDIENSTVSDFNIQEVQVAWPSIVQTTYLQEFHLGPTGGNASDWACAPDNQGSKQTLPPYCLWAGGAVPSVFSSKAPSEQYCLGLAPGATCYNWKNATETLAAPSLAAGTTKAMYFVLSIPAARANGYDVSVRLSGTCGWISAKFERP